MSTTSARRVTAVAIAAVLLLSACGDDSDQLEGNVVKDGLGCSILSVDRPTEKPEVEVPAADAEAPTDVVTDDLVEPEEEACDVTKRSYLTFDMVGVKASDGTEFVNTYGQERPLTVQLGQGQILPGLETGFAEMKVGGRRQITIPASQAYGEEGNPAQGIGPNETLVFVADLVSVLEAAEFCNDNQGIPPAPEGVAGSEGKPTDKIDMPVRPFDELGTTTLREGDGAEVQDGDAVKFHYVGISCASGQQFESSWDTGTPLDGIAGGDNLIEGMSTGLIGTKVGELRRLDIPAEQAYGTDALTFLIQVTEIVPPAPEGETTTTAAAGAEAPDTTVAAGAEDETTTTADAGDESTTTTAGEGDEGDDGASTTTTEAG